MTPQMQAINHGTASLELAYAIALTGVLAACIRARAGWRKFLVAPLLAAPLVPLVGILVSVTGPLLRMFDVDTEGYVQFGFGIALTVAVGYVAGRRLAAHRASSSVEHRRGAIVMARRSAAPGRSLLRRLGSWVLSRLGPPSLGRGSKSPPRHSTGITLAEVPVLPEDETKHFKLIGSTGTGKSTAIRELLSAALRRGDRAIIADPDGGYLNRFYAPSRGDAILNPFDPDARKWDPFGEIVNDYDIEQLARSLIPDGGDPDRIWFEYARTFFTEVMRQCIRAGARDDAQLFRLLTAASDKELRVMLAATAAGPFLEEGNEKMFGSLRSVASAAVRALAYTTRQKGEPFSVRQWVRESAARPDSTAGVLFLPYSAGQIAALRSVISAWMRLAIFEAMDRPEGDQRLWFVVDELDALGEIDGLKDALARLRKFGGRCILGFQSIAQVSATYGKGAAETLVENCSNTLILRCSASEHGGTSEFASKLIGQREVLHTTRSRTRRPLHWMASTTTSQHLKIEPAVMASEIERLPDLAGFLKLASCPDWQSVTLHPVNAPAPSARPPRTTAAPPPSTSVAPSALPAGATAPASATAPARATARGATARANVTAPASPTAPASATAPARATARAGTTARANVGDPASATVAAGTTTLAGTTVGSAPSRAGTIAPATVTTARPATPQRAPRRLVPTKHPSPAKPARPRSSAALRGAAATDPPSPPPSTPPETATEPVRDRSGGAQSSHPPP